jgi:hypothetical protein
MMTPLLFALALAPTSEISETSAPPVPHVAESGEKSDRVHLQMDTDATFGIGGQMFLGGQFRLAASLEHWTTSRALGTWDFGGEFGYHNEPVFMAPWIDRSEIRGATHRLQLLASVGHSVHMGKRRRAALGLHVFGGWNHWVSSYAVDYAQEGVHGRAVVAKAKPVVGAELRFTYRFHRNVGVNAVFGAPFPTASSYAIGYGWVGAGLSFFLR